MPQAILDKIFKLIEARTEIVGMFIDFFFIGISIPLHLFVDHENPDIPALK
jgi:hypothetical protein